MRYIIMGCLIIGLICIGVYFIMMLISSNITYSVWYDSSCSMLLDQLEFSKKTNERLFIKLNQGKIWGLEQIIREKC